MRLCLRGAAALLQSAPQKGDVLGQLILCDGQTQVLIGLIASAYHDIHMLLCGQVADLGLMRGQCPEVGRACLCWLRLSHALIQ